MGDGSLVSFLFFSCRLLSSCCFHTFFFYGDVALSTYLCSSNKFDSAFGCGKCSVLLFFHFLLSWTEQFKSGTLYCKFCTYWLT